MLTASCVEPPSLLYQEERLEVAGGAVDSPTGASGSQLEDRGPLNLPLRELREPGAGLLCPRWFQKADTLLHRITTSKGAHLLTQERFVQLICIFCYLPFSYICILYATVTKSFYWYLSVKSTDVGQEWPLIP